MVESSGNPRTELTEASHPKKIRAYLYLLRTIHDFGTRFFSGQSTPSKFLYLAALIGAWISFAYYHIGSHQSLKLIDTSYSGAPINCSSCSGVESRAFCGVSSHISVIQSLVLAAHFLTYSQLKAGNFVPAYDWERMRDVESIVSTADEDEGNATAFVAVAALYHRARAAAAAAAAASSSPTAENSTTAHPNSSRTSRSPGAWPRGVVSRLHESAMAALGYFDRRSRMTRSGARYNAATAGGLLGVQVRSASIFRTL